MALKEKIHVVLEVEQKLFKMIMIMHIQHNQGNKVVALQAKTFSFSYWGLNKFGYIHTCLRFKFFYHILQFTLQVCPKKSGQVESL
jgi:hypothetical protein